METFLEFMKSAGGAAIVVGLFEFFKWRRDRKAQLEDTAAQQKVIDCTARGEEITALRENVENLTVAMRLQMYDKIKGKAKQYIARGYITVEEYEDLTDMHRVYHNELGGNGFLDNLMRDVDHLEKAVI